MTNENPTIVFFPEGAFGPTNNCVGIGNVLRERGARVVFVIEESFRGTLAAKGFEEALMRLGPAPEVPEEPGQYWKDFVAETAPVFRESTFTQLEGFIKPVWESLIDGARYANPRLTEIFDELQPDVIVEDNVVAFPAVPASKKPWVRIVSCNPLELRDHELPPPFSGLATEDRSGWIPFRTQYRELHRALQREFSDWCREVCGLPLPEPEFMLESPYLNLYLYPRELDYPRAAPLAPTWHRIESSVRATDEPFELPDEIRDGGGKLIYLSLGSLGSADVELMNRLVGLLAETPHRIIVSKGPQHELIQLADNMVGAEFLPQTSLLPLVDLVITHGGNNTVTESMHFGKPMIVLPLFWDQHDNARRVQETRYGAHLATYQFSPMEFYTAIDALLSDTALHARMAETATRLQGDPGTVRAADLIWRLAQEKNPIVEP
jgi:MGT family glycosyltransferase